jgi:hypothetical protein
MRVQSGAMQSIMRVIARIFSALRHAPVALLLAWDKLCARLSISEVSLFARTARTSGTESLVAYMLPKVRSSGYPNRKLRSP